MGNAEHDVPQGKAAQHEDPESQGTRREAATREESSTLAALGARETTSARARTPKPKVPTVWLDRAKFAAGVLFVWGAVSFLKVVWEDFHRRDFEGCRLEENELCRVFDAFQPGSPWSPTPCSIETIEYMRDPENHRDDSLTRATIDMDTIVLVKADWDEPVLKTAGPHSARIDERMVFVQFVTGPYSGRDGFIARHKLNPFRIRDVRDRYR